MQHLTAGDVRLDDLPRTASDDQVRDVLDTFRVAARIHPESLGAYVITMASAPSDVLAVEFLQMAAGTSHPQRVVPLFETARDLEQAGAIMSDLLAIPWYRKRIGGHQEVMIGYSDSAKDAGRMSADWALYRAQEEVVAACEKSGVRLTLFHGRGGSIGRGGGPTYLAIQSQPPGSVRGTLRATEQGEMIQAKFGLVDIAIRTLEVYTTATLEAAVAPQPSPKPEWRACMDQIAGRARATYRSVVYEDPRFIPYFRTATPEPELTQVSIGSRPARRAPGKGVESLRAIPWQFAWTQTRLMLPSWLGIEDALGWRPQRDAPRDVFALGVLRIDDRPRRDDARESRSAASRRNTIGWRPTTCVRLGSIFAIAWRARSTRCSPSRATTRCSRRTPCCGDRSTCAIHTSIRSTSCRSSCFAASAGPIRIRPSSTRSSSP